MSLVEWGDADVFLIGFCSNLLRFVIMKSIPNKVKGTHVVDFPPETR